MADDMNPPLLARVVALCEAGMDERAENLLVEALGLTRTCPACDGSGGRMYEREYYGPDGEEGTAVFSGECTDCEGAGRQVHTHDGWEPWQ